MAITFHPHDTAIIRGIKTVGVGKKGSKPLSPELAREILADLKTGAVPPAAQGAFFAGLFFKGIEADERVLDQYFKEPGTLLNADRLADALTEEAPSSIRAICRAILRKETLDRATAYTLGKFLISDEPGDTARGLVASALRVRYETDDEYEGLLAALNESLVAQSTATIDEHNPVIQLAEPFDGNDHSYMITPLLGRYLQSLRYTVIHLVGRNSGPKLCFNLADVAQALGIPFGLQTECGWFLHQKDLSPSIDRWVELRRQTVKRPFLATLERFINPVGASILAASAFHPPYGEKMTTIAERAGFPKIIIVRNGIEGSMAFPLKRDVRLLCSARQTNGSYLRHEIIFEPEQFLGRAVELEEKIDSPKAADNARLIKEYLTNGSSGHRHFDLRLQATCEGFRLALEWLNARG